MNGSGKIPRPRSGTYIMAETAVCCPLDQNFHGRVVRHGVGQDALVEDLAVLADIFYLRYKYAQYEEGGRIGHKNSRRRRLATRQLHPR